MDNQNNIEHQVSPPITTPPPPNPHSHKFIIVLVGLLILAISLYGGYLLLASKPQQSPTSAKVQAIPVTPSIPTESLSPTVNNFPLFPEAAYVSQSTTEQCGTFEVYRRDCNALKYTYTSVSPTKDILNWYSTKTAQEDWICQGVAKDQDPANVLPDKISCAHKGILYSLWLTPNGNNTKMELYVPKQINNTANTKIFKDMTGLYQITLPGSWVADDTDLSSGVWILPDKKFLPTGWYYSILVTHPNNTDKLSFKQWRTKYFSPEDAAKYTYTTGKINGNDTYTSIIKWGQSYGEETYITKDNKSFVAFLFYPYNSSTPYPEQEKYYNTYKKILSSFTYFDPLEDLKKQK